MPQIAAIDISGWSKLIEKIGKDLHDGKIQPGDLNESFIRESYTELNKAAGSGYGKDWNKVNNNGEGNDLKESNLPNPAIAKMKQNIYKFSAAKNSTMLQDINDKLYKDGKLVELQELKNELDALNIKYNQSWLEAEYRTARQSGIMAQKWDAIQDNRKLFPNLIYRTQGDSKVRPEHEKLDGVIAPIDHPFWKKYYPPNGWRCRCDAVQTAQKVTVDIPDDVEGVSKEFQINIGVSGQIFNEDEQDGHKFFALAKSDPKWSQRFEKAKLEAPTETHYKSKNGAKVDINIYADLNDLPKNYECAVTLAEQLKMDVTIRPHANVKGNKNPELEHKGIKGDRVSPKSKNVKSATADAFSKKLSKKKDGQLAQEESSFLAIEIWFEANNRNASDFIAQSWSKFNQYEQLDFVVFYKTESAIRIDRAELKEGFGNYQKKVAEWLK